MKKTLVVISVLFTATGALAGTNGGIIGHGLLTPDTGSLGAGNLRVNLIDVVVGASFAYGVTDYVDVEIGDYLFVMGNLGIRFHSPPLKKNFRLSVLE